MIALTRCYCFPAAHVLAIRGATDAENRRLYGKCANPAGHGHDYGVEVTLGDPSTSARGSSSTPPASTRSSRSAWRAGSRTGT